MFSGRVALLSQFQASLDFFKCTWDDAHLRDRLKRSYNIILKEPMLNPPNKNRSSYVKFA